jgi:hypothetical protein
MTIPHSNMSGLRASRNAGVPGKPLQFPKVEPGPNRPIYLMQMGVLLKKILRHPIMDVKNDPGWGYTDAI